MPTASKAEDNSSSSAPTNLLSSFCNNAAGLDVSSRSPLGTQQADYLQAPAKTDPAPMVSPVTTPPTPATKAAQHAESIKLRLAEKKVNTANEALRDAQWDTIDPSEDEEWDKVPSDEGAEWDVLER